MTGMLLTTAIVLIVPGVAASCNNVIVGSCQPDPNECYWQTGVFVNGNFVAGYSQSQDKNSGGFCDSGSDKFCIGAAGVGVYYDPDGIPLVGVPCHL